VKIATKIYYRLKRECRDLSSYARSKLISQLTEKDVLKKWQSETSSDSFESCIREWLERKHFLLSENIAASSQVMSEANRILEGRTTIYGKEVNLNNPSLWHADPLTNNKWDSTIHYSRFSVFHPSHDGETDIRRLWELGRFGWAVNLAQAFASTQKPEYVKAWQKFIDDFIKSNRPEYGPHWLNAMEPAMRAIQWGRAYSYIISRDIDIHTNIDFYKRLVMSLLEHGQYIYTHLEWTPSGRTNHYISNLVGLLSIAVLIPEWKPAHAWKEFAIQQLSEEIEIQTDKEGFHSEASTAYHHFVTELYSFVSALDRVHQLGFSSRFHGRVRQMIEVNQTIRGKENIDPRLGDDDSSTLFNDADVLKKIFPWKLRMVTLSNSMKYESSGFYILRSSEVNCIVQCGPNGQEGVGGHAHNDKLSFVLNHQGKPLIIDSGTYSYSANIKLRNQFRSIYSHNTLIVDDQEQNELLDWRALRDRSRAKIIKWEDSDDTISFSGEHYGFTSIGCIHRRTIELKKSINQLTFLDEIISTNPHKVCIQLHFCPSLKKEDFKLENNALTIPQGKILFKTPVKLEIVTKEISLVYGTKLQTSSLLIKKETQGNEKIPWVIELK
jgi:hypothetical protein